jgi:hypothetical protein
MYSEKYQCKTELGVVSEGCGGVAVDVDVRVDQHVWRHYHQPRDA